MSPFSNNWTIIFPYKKVESADIRGVLVYASYESEVSVVDQPKVNIESEIYPITIRIIRFAIEQIDSLNFSRVLRVYGPDINKFHIS